MKKIIIVAVFIFSINKIYSQKYRLFDSTTVWGTEYAQKVQTNCYTLENDKYFIKGYELNNGNVWLKVFYNYTKYWHPASAGNCYTMAPVLNPTNGNNIPLGYLYNDSINKRVYFTTTLTANYVPPANKILYDFNKVLGDTMYFNNPYMPPNMYAKFKITAIDSILFSGKYHKRFSGTSDFILNSSVTVSFAEGIGSSIDPFSPVRSSFFESWSYLLCFASPSHSLSVSSHTVLANGGCNNLVMKLDENEENSFGIYPNPASDNLYITVKQSAYENINYEFINVVGELKQKGALTAASSNISLHTLASGIYFINFYKEGAIVSSKKIVIDRN